MNFPKLCNYQNFFGKPGEGIHSYRLFNVAIADVIMTVIAALIITNLRSKEKLGFEGISNAKFFLITLSILIGIGIILHKLFCVDTTINKLLFS